MDRQGQGADDVGVAYSRACDTRSRSVEWRDLIQED